MDAVGATGARGVPFVVGAYAALPADAADRDAFYELLAAEAWVTGLEVPFRGDPTDAAALAAAWRPAWDSVLTLIPGTMQRVGADPAFGLASDHEDGRRAALDFAEQARLAVLRSGEGGAPAIGTVLVHSAPTGRASESAFARSLADLSARDWGGARLAIEHCDRFVPGRACEKGFLDLDAEIAAAREAGVGVHLNWGRSYLDDRDPGAPLVHVRTAAAAGVLVGLVFSGASGQATRYGGPWADAHLPLVDDEPVSELTPARVAACAAAALASPVLGYLGAKVSLPAELTPGARVAALRRVYEAADFGGRA